MIETAPTVEDAVREVFGHGVDVVRRSPVSGGCIANGAQLDLSDGSRVFVKESRTLPARMFPAEAVGLLALRSGDGPRVPLPLAVWPPVNQGGGAARGHPFILMEWVETGRPGSGFHAGFGRALARLHQCKTSERFGFEMDNYIGSTEQPNEWSGSWTGFFALRRLGFQSELALSRGRIDSGLAKTIKLICSRLGSMLPEPEVGSVLHGDLWGGNYLCDESGRAVLIDPAVYYGHPEADLAMTELFGGFRPAFYSAYQEVNPLTPGYGERRDLYNLYHMLNHLNIFGSGYLGSVRSIVARYS